MVPKSPKLAEFGCGSAALSESVKHFSFCNSGLSGLGVMAMNNRFLYSCLLFSLLLVSCASQQKVVTTRPPAEKPKTVRNFEKMNEGFDPVALNDDDIEFE